jgi:hypothetical protein
LSDEFFMLLGVVEHERGLTALVVRVVQEGDDAHLVATLAELFCHEV